MLNVDTPDHVLMYYQQYPIAMVSLRHSRSLVLQAACSLWWLPGFFLCTSPRLPEFSAHAYSTGPFVPLIGEEAIFLF